MWPKVQLLCAELESDKNKAKVHFTISGNVYWRIKSLQSKLGCGFTMHESCALENTVVYQCSNYILKCTGCSKGPVSQFRKWHFHFTKIEKNNACTIIFQSFIVVNISTVADAFRLHSIEYPRNFSNKNYKEIKCAKPYLPFVEKQNK